MSWIEKLDYLTETKRLIREKIEEYGAEITEEDTFRSYVEKLDDIMPFRYIYDAITGNPQIEHTILGDIELTEYDILAPKIRYPNISGEYTIPILTSWSTSVDSSVKMVNHAIIYHNIIPMGDDVVLKASVYGGAPRAVIFPSNINLVASTIRLSGSINNALSIGLGFGDNIKSSASTWIYNNMLSSSYSQKIVKIPRGFKMPSGVTFYLNKIKIKQDCLQEMVENIYDYIGNGESTDATRTISIGSTNLALLTTEEKDIALAKGWRLS